MRSRHFVRTAAAVLGATVLVTAGATPGAANLGNQGLQGGWAIDNQGHVNFVHSLTQQLPLIEEAGAGAVRVNFRLGECFSNWTAVGCANADEPRTALGLYDQVVNAALQRNLKVVGLISNESWHGTQAEWTASNAENAGGSGDNAYIRSFATNAAGVLASHFAGRVATWEVWNEPNAYSESPSPGVYTGSSFMYPSNFAWLLKRSYAAIKTHQPGTSSTVVSGGLFGHDIGGASVVVTNPEGTRQRITKRGTVEMEKQLSPQALDKPLASGPTCRVMCRAGRTTFAVRTAWAKRRLAGRRPPTRWTQSGSTCTSIRVGSPRPQS
jgi:hypothetical protein